MKITLRIIGQLIPILIFTCIGTYLFYLRIPGNQTFTDNDLTISSIFYGLFILIGIVLTLNSFFHIIKNHRTTYRIGVMIFVIGLIIAVMLPREFVIWTLYGAKKSEYTGFNMNDSEYISVELKLFENSKFLCSSSNMNLTVENIGTYELTNTSLHLTFENKKSEFIGTKFETENNTLYCLDCNTEIRLTKNESFQ